MAADPTHTDRVSTLPIDRHCASCAQIRRPSMPNQRQKFRTPENSFCKTYMLPPSSRLEHRVQNYLRKLDGSFVQLKHRISFADEQPSFSRQCPWFSRSDSAFKPHSMPVGRRRSARTSVTASLGKASRPGSAHIAKDVRVLMLRTIFCYWSSY